MRTPEFVQDQAENGLTIRVTLARGIARRLPLVSRVYLTLITALLAAADHQPAYSQIYAGTSDCNISTQESNPYVDFFIDSLGRSRRLETIPGTNGRPPNNPDSYITTVADSIDGAQPILYQVPSVIYPVNARHKIAIEKKYLDASFNKIYLATSYAFDNDQNTARPAIVVIGNANNPTDYSNHFLFPIDALPQGGIFESAAYDSFLMKEDADGKYLEVGLRKYGSLRVRLDKGGMYSKTELAMSRRAFLAIVGNSFSGN